MGEPQKEHGDPATGVRPQGEEARSPLRPDPAIGYQPPRLNLQRLKVIALLLPAFFLLLAEALRRVSPQAFLASWEGHLIALLVGVVLFSLWIFRALEKVQAHILQQNQDLATLHEQTSRRGQQLQALNEAGLSITAEHSLETVLQQVVDLSCQLARARYGAVAVVEDDRLEYFITTGLSPEERERIGPLPTGKGLLGAVPSRGRPLRMANLQEHPDFTGFPPGHPPMTSFLGVPITFQGSVIGSLYLTDKEDATEFSLEDERLMTMFATQAAIAIENARLYRRAQNLAVLEERERIGQDLHDGIIQSIYAVGLHLENCTDMLAEAPAEVRDRLEYSVESLNDIIRDIRNYILDLRPQVYRGKSLGTGLRELVEEFRLNTLVSISFHDQLEGQPHPPLSEDQIIQLLQITREALTNVAKHAQATHVQVSLEGADGQAVLRVEDNGKGFQPQHTWGELRQGLQNMHQRAQSLGGAFQVESQPGKGTRVTVRIPMEVSQGIT